MIRGVFLFYLSENVGVRNCKSEDLKLQNKIKSITKRYHQKFMKLQSDLSDEMKKSDWLVGQKRSVFKSSNSLF